MTHSIHELYTTERISHEIIEQKIKNKKNLENITFQVAKKVQEEMILSEGAYGIRIINYVDEVLQTIPSNAQLNPLEYVKEAAELLKSTGLEIFIQDQSELDRDFKMPEKYLYWCLSPQISLQISLENARRNAENT